MNPREQAAALAARLHALAVFRGLRADGVFCALLALLDELAGPAPGTGVAPGATEMPGGSPVADESALRLDTGAVIHRTDLYCAFVAALYRNGSDLGLHLLRLVRESDNPAIRLRAAGKKLPAELELALLAELETLSALSALGSDALIPLVAEPAALQTAPGRVGSGREASATGGQAGVGSPTRLPAYAATPQDFTAFYTARLANATTAGYGTFAAHHMFSLGQGAEIALLPVQNPDPQRLAELTGYEAERERVVLNTRALLAGLAAANVLLYGDAGTGKSSTVKAIANEFRGQGLRLVEVRKNQLYQIPQLMETLAGNPLKFILFIDDLSFPENDGDFTALKAILEGNVSARPQNVVVYATSNRRHLLREQFAARAGGEVNLADTLEEQSSLAARFGLTLTFLKPDRALYGEMVAAMAAELGLETPLPRLLERAEAHAIRHGGRSGRTARQFVELMQAEEALQSPL